MICSFLPLTSLFFLDSSSLILFYLPTLSVLVVSLDCREQNCCYVGDGGDGVDHVVVVHVVVGHVVVVHVVSSKCVCPVGCVLSMLLVVLVLLIFVLFVFCCW